GAIASGGVRVLNEDVIDSLAVPPRVIDAVTEKETRELQRRGAPFRGNPAAPGFAHPTVLVIGGWSAPASTAPAAIRALRQLNTRRIIVATPVVAHGTLHMLKPVADEIVSVLTPRDFYGVGQWYQNFTQTTDEEVRALLAENEGRRSA